MTQPGKMQYAANGYAPGLHDAWEQPALFSAELRAAFRPLRQGS